MANGCLFKKTAAFYSVRQIPPIVFSPLRVPVSNTISSHGQFQEVCFTDGGLLHDCLHCKIKNMFN